MRSRLSGGKVAGGVGTAVAGGAEVGVGFALGRQPAKNNTAVPEAGKNCCKNFRRESCLFIETLRILASNGSGQKDKKPLGSERRFAHLCDS